MSGAGLSSVPNKQLKAFNINDIARFNATDN